MIDRLARRPPRRARASPRRSPRPSRAAAGARGRRRERRAPARSARASPATSAAGAIPTPEPALFSFNSPLGACETCHGFGRIARRSTSSAWSPTPRARSRASAIAPFATPSGRALPARPAARVRRPRAADGRRRGATSPTRSATAWSRATTATGTACAATSSSSEARRYKVQARVTIARYRRFDPCERCGGTRLRPEALAVLVGGRHIGEVSRLTIGELDAWLAAAWRSTPARRPRAARACSPPCARASAPRARSGLGYLSLERQVRTLSGGEAQRIQLATALGGALTGTLYVLDEPSVGLHARDVARLLGRAARDPRPGQHASWWSSTRPRSSAAADHVIDLGPGRGPARRPRRRRGHRRGGAPRTRTLAHRPRAARRVPASSAKRPRDGRAARCACAARARTTCSDVDVDVPLGQLVVVTGVSGAGKSSLVRSVLVGHLRARSRARRRASAIEGARAARRGRGGRADAAGAQPALEPRHASRRPSRASGAASPRRPRRAAQGLTPGWFSFNVAGGRCETCEGTGETVVDMQFLEDVRVPCEALRRDALPQGGATRSALDGPHHRRGARAHARRGARVVRRRRGDRRPARAVRARRPRLPHARAAALDALGRRAPAHARGARARRRARAARSTCSTSRPRACTPSEVQVLLDCLDAAARRRRERARGRAQPRRDPARRPRDRPRPRGRARAAGASWRRVRPRRSPHAQPPIRAGRSRRRRPRG